MWILELSWESPLDEPPPFPDVAIEDAAQLREALRARAGVQPHVYRLRRREKPSPPVLFDQIGLCLGGGPWGMADRIWRVGLVRSYRAAQPDGASNPAEVCFADGREGVCFQAGKLLPVARVIEAAVFFVEHGELSPLLQWVGWRVDQVK